MPTGLREGLGGEEVLVSGLGMLTQHPFFVGSLTTTDQIIAGSTVTATGFSSSVGISATGSLVAGGLGVLTNTGSPYGMGLVVPFTARSNISGGMFVSMSGGLAYAAAASTLQPIGVAVPGANVASGGTVNVVINGIVPAIAEGTIAVNAAAMMGAGGGLNTVAPYNVASASVSGARLFSTLDSVTSGTTSTVFIRL